MKRQHNNRKNSLSLRKGWSNCVATLCGLAVMAVSSESAAQTPCSEPGNTPGQTGCVTFNYRGQEVTYTTVRAADGNIWLQQNLGSAQVADTSADADAYGHMFQWGRWDDGHQLTNSTISTSSVEPNNPAGFGAGSEFFYNSTPGWWSTNALTDTWTAPTPAAATATDGCDPCKALGEYWRLPSPEEWQAVVTGENMTNVLTAFESNLKLSTNGTRNASGTFGFVGARGYYWSSTPSSTGAKYLYYSNFIVNPTAGTLRAQGAAIRCVKVLPPQPTGILIHTENDVYADILADDGTLQVQAEITPATADQSITWSIVPVTGTATISSTGLVTALTNGTVWAKAVSTANASVLDSLEVLLAGQISLAESILVSTEDNVPATITTNGGTLQVTSEILPATANQAINWSIVNGTAAATISTTGLVTAQSNGTVWAKAVSAENTAIKDSIEITISGQIIPVTDIMVTTLNNVTPTITTNGGTVQVIAEILPADAEQSVSWSIVNTTGTATVSNNELVTAQTNGTVWAKAVSAANTTIKDSIEITISNQLVPVTDVTVTTVNSVAAAITINGGTLPLQALVLPATASQAVNWSIVSGTGTATISNTGIVTAITNGIVWAKAVSIGNAMMRDSLSITISGQSTAGITEATTSAFNLYPNPVSNALYFTSVSSEAVTITVTDLMGRTIAIHHLEAAELAAPANISTTNWATGMYRIQAQSGSHTQVLSIIKN